MDRQANGVAGARRMEWLALTLTIGARRRTFAPPAWLCLLLAAAGPLVIAWSLGATVYVVFHDPLLASLIACQTDMQYAYEDRIAALRTQLDRETSRGLVDRHTLETSVHDLEARSAMLEQRAALIDSLVTRTSLPASPRNPLLVAEPTSRFPSGARAYAEPEAAAPLPLPLRLDGFSESRQDQASSPRVPMSNLPMSNLPTSSLPISSLPISSLPISNLPISNLPISNLSSSSSAVPDLPWPLGKPAGKSAAVDGGSFVAAETGGSVAATLSGVERDQARSLAALREPTMRAIGRLKSALLDVGMGARLVGAASSDMGGPFVPLPAGALGFEQDAALLRDALIQADRLTALVAKVPLRKPLSGPLDVTSTFGARLDPFLGRPAMHTGIDFRESYGDGVHATAAGLVTIAGTDGGYGTMVEVDHGNGLSTRYAHLSSVSVAVNQTVEAGDLVGHVGSSGRATGPHLHYETRIDGQPVDPTRFLRAGSRLFD